MTVCHCEDVNDKDIIAAINSGCTTYYQVQDITGAGRTCGSCAPAVVSIMAKRLPDARSF